MIGLLSPAPGRAQAADLLVSVDWLTAHADDPDLVLLHVGPEEEFATEHIPGAVLITRDDFSNPGSHTPESLILELPEPDAFQAALRRAGVSESSRIVVYWGEEWVTPTARVVFTLDWAGLGDHTALLDGGLTAWKAAGGSVTGEVVEPPTGDVSVRPRDLVVEAEWVEAHGMEPGYRIVDARAPAFYDGVREDRGKAGHIPGAGNLPWTDLVDEETLLLHPRERLRELFDAAGVEEGDTVVGYCHIGQYATLMLFSARLLGHEVVLYDGAFQDWAGRDLPVEGGN
jgi:thiosulfate/3-mercaptopyruvate sulfurtransferase